MRFQMCDSHVFDVRKGIDLSDEALFLMLGEEDLKEDEKAFIVSYLRRIDFRGEVTVSSDIFIKHDVVHFLPGNLVRPFSLPIHQLINEYYSTAKNSNWQKNIMVIHPDGQDVFDVTPSQMAQIKIVADTLRELA